MYMYVYVCILLLQNPIYNKLMTEKPVAVKILVVGDY
jgi:hypothetical protein